MSEIKPAGILLWMVMIEGHYPPPHRCFRIFLRSFTQACLRHTMKRLIGQNTVSLKHHTDLLEQAVVFLCPCFHFRLALLYNFPSESPEQTYINHVLETLTKEGSVACLATHLQILNYIKSLPCGLLVDFSGLWHVPVLPGSA